MTSSSSTIRRLVKRERIHRIPFSENCLRRDRSLSSCLIRSYSSFHCLFPREILFPHLSRFPACRLRKKRWPVFPSPCLPPEQDRTSQSGKEGRSGPAFSRCSTSVRCPRQRILSDKCMARIFVFSRGARSLSDDKELPVFFASILVQHGEKMSVAFMFQIFMRDTMARTRVSLSKPNSFRSRIRSSSFAVKRSVSIPL